MTHSSTSSDTLSLRDALPILTRQLEAAETGEQTDRFQLLRNKVGEEEIAEVVSRWTGIPVSKMLEAERDKLLKMEEDRKSTRLNSSHVAISYAVFCLNIRIKK